MAKAPGKRSPKKPRTGSRAGAKAVPRGRAKGRQQRALADVARVLAKLDRPSAIIGGIAVISWGYARFTADIDCAICAPIEALTTLHETFEAAGFEAREADAVAFARESLVLLLRHTATGVAVDVSLALLAFELEALKAAVPRKYGDIEIRVPRLEDLFVYKMIAARPKDLQDLRALLSLGYEVDTDHVTSILGAFDEVLETDRRGEWLRLLKDTSP